MTTLLVIDAAGHEHRLIADEAGVRCLYDDALAPLLSALGNTITRRASHVEPDQAGGWQADMSPVGGPILRGFTLRADALAAEREWLLAHDIPFPRE